MSAHTPGPWTLRMSSTCSAAWPEIVQVGADQDDEELARGATAYVFDYERRGTGKMAVTFNERPDCFVQHIDGDTAMANAALMAAAPDMLEALTRAERKLAAYVGVCSGDKELANTVLPMVRAAIAKATGGAS